MKLLLMLNVPFIVWHPKYRLNMGAQYTEPV
jgi:hypothetical protein